MTLVSMAFLQYGFLSSLAAHAAGTGAGEGRLGVGRCLWHPEMGAGCQGNVGVRSGVLGSDMLGGCKGNEAWCGNAWVLRVRGGGRIGKAGGKPGGFARKRGEAGPQGGGWKGKKKWITYKNPNRIEVAKQKRDKLAVKLGQRAMRNNEIRRVKQLATRAELIKAGRPWNEKEVCCRQAHFLCNCGTAHDKREALSIHHHARPCHHTNAP